MYIDPREAGTKERFSKSLRIKFSDFINSGEVNREYMQMDININIQSNLIEYKVFGA